LFPEFVRAAQYQAEANDLHVMVWDSHNSAARERAALEAMLDRRVDGVVLVSDHLEVDEIEPLHAAGVAVVTTDRRLDRPWVDMVSEDLVGTAEAATRHLLELGHIRVAHVSGDTSTVVGAARLAGYRNALDAFGIDFDPSLVLGGSFDRSAAELATRELLSAPVPPTAVFAANDVLAVGVLRACSRAGLELPMSMSVIGIDNTRESEVVSPGLTTMDPHPSSIAERLVELLTSRMAVPSLAARRELVGASLVERASTHRLV
jgi:LacI family transcriptional regulator